MPTFKTALMWLRTNTSRVISLVDRTTRLNLVARAVSVVFLLVLVVRISNADMVNVIVETDLTFDVDDVGALAVIHALADRKEAQILGVSYNEVHPDGVRAIAAINAWYDRAETPIARYNGTLEDPDESRYLSYLANVLSSSNNAKADNALDFYANTLSTQEDQSVTIISLGFLNNLAALLRTYPDLVKRKVRLLVAMGGRVNDSFNFVRHGLIEETQLVIEYWPTPLLFTDFGGDLHTGVSLSSTPPENPVREAYFRWFNGSFKGRSSWDQIAVLVGVRGELGGFEFTGNMTGRLRNGFTWHMDGKHRSYARPTKSRDFYLNEVESLMSVAPRTR